MADLAAQKVSEITFHNMTDELIGELSAEYLTLSIDGLDDKEGYKRVHDSRLIVKGHRIQVEKTRKGLKADALEYGRQVDREAKRITALLIPIENHLQSEELWIDNEKLRIKNEKEEAERADLQNRIDALSVLGAEYPVSMVQKWSQIEFDHYIEQAQKDYDIEQERLRVEAQAKADREAAEKAEREAEDQRLVAERVNLECLANEQRAREQEIQAEQERVIEEIRAEQDRIKKEIQAERERVIEELRIGQEQLDRKREAEETEANAKREEEQRIINLKREESQRQIWAEREQFEAEKKVVQDQMDQIEEAKRLLDAPSEEIVDETTDDLKADESVSVVWQCKVGPIDPATLPDLANAFLFKAIWDAFDTLGVDLDSVNCFSGWDGEFSDDELVDMHNGS